VTQRPISRIIHPSAGENIGPMHNRTLNNAAKDSNSGKAIGIDLITFKSKTGQGYIKSSDAYKKSAQTLDVPDLQIGDRPSIVVV
jgi:hypothetical protein